MAKRNRSEVFAFLGLLTPTSFLVPSFLVGIKSLSAVVLYPYVELERPTAIKSDCITAEANKVLSKSRISLEEIEVEAQVSALNCISRGSLL